ncbi:MAG: flagellar protein FlgN [Clostridia bacterium]|nr:flagellar protein FlgN [Clostridia bacterium]PZN11656.1 MAG: flagellar protein FlgN [Caldicoprobacter oshimai]
MEELQKFVDILERECQLYGTLLELSKKKVQVIVDNNIAELEKMVEMEEQLIFELKSLEDEREDLVSDFAQRNGISSKEVTVSYLVSQAEGQVKEKLKQLQERLYGIIEEQKQINQLNERLIKNNLDFINFSIGLITGRNQTGGIYSKTGETTVKRGGSLIDKKA